MHEDHSHIHDHAHEHGFDHDHPHTHEAHEHEGLVSHTCDETLKLLEYMLDHNRHHGEDLHEIYHALVQAGKTQAADIVHEAMHNYDHGNEKLAEALKLLGGK